MPRCQNCGEPWDLHHLLHDAVGDIAEHLHPLWDTLIQKGANPLEDEEFGQQITGEFAAAGWRFGASLASVRHCPCCPAGVAPFSQTEEAANMSFLTDLMGDDVDGAATMSDLGGGA